ncbi:MAG: hypothetical protein JWM20_965 [Patescibacteria group bacterium]|nr:hypothetical protein [Patescibacteria group bacterium]
MGFYVIVKKQNSTTFIVTFLKKIVKVSFPDLWKTLYSKKRL